MRWQRRLFMEIKVFICPNFSALLCSVEVHLHLTSFINSEWCLGATVLYLSPVIRGVCNIESIKKPKNLPSISCHYEQSDDPMPHRRRARILPLQIFIYWLFFASSSNPNFFNRYPQFLPRTLISFKTQLQLQFLVYCTHNLMSLPCHVIFNCHIIITSDHSAVNFFNVVNVDD